MARRRPWRATAFVPDWTAPNGRRRTVAGRVAACERGGLQAFIDRQEAAGNVVDVVLTEATIPGLMGGNDDGSAEQ